MPVAEMRNKLHTSASSGNAQQAVHKCAACCAFLLFHENVQLAIGLLERRAAG